MTTTKQAAERLLRARITFDRADQERKETIRAANEAMAPIYAELEAAKEAVMAVLDEPGDAKRVAGLGVVRPSYRDALIKAGGVDPETGEVVPGMGRTVGAPTMTVKPSDYGRQLAVNVLAGLLQIEDGAA